jgi:hypothetical protein
MRVTSLSVVVVASASYLMVGCASVGACAGTDGQFHECQQDFTADECEEMNTKGFNGYTWTHHPDKSCPDLGYGEECSYGSFRRSCN